MRRLQEMLFPLLEHFPTFRVPSAVPSQEMPGSEEIRRFRHLPDSRAGQLCRAIELFRACGTPWVRINFAAHCSLAIDLIDLIDSTDSAEGAGTAALGLASDLAAGALAGRGSASGIPSGLTRGGGAGRHTDTAITAIPTTTFMFTPTLDPPIRTTIQLRLHNKTIKATRMAIGSRQTDRALRPRQIPQT